MTYQALVHAAPVPPEGGWQVPDPAAPFLAQTAGPVGQRWLSQRAKRSQILAATRMCMAENGFNGVQLRPIARQCGLSVQTIYNIVGGRSQVLRDSSEDWVVILAADAREEHAEDPDTPLIFRIVEKFWASPLCWPNYVAHAVETSAAGPEPLNEVYVGSSTRILHEELAALRERGQLCASVDPRSLARQLTLLTHALICAWIFGGRDVQQYRRDLLNGPALMLRGALCGEEGARIETLFDETRH